MRRVLPAAGMDVVAPTAIEQDGAVETREESRRCAEPYEAQEKQDGQDSDPEHSDFTATDGRNGCVKSGNVPYHE
jgi:hypothetical protein